MWNIHNRLTVLEVASGTEKDPIVLECQLKKLKNGSLFLTYTAGGDREPCQENKTV